MYVTNIGAVTTVEPTPTTIFPLYRTILMAIHIVMHSDSALVTTNTLYHTMHHIRIACTITTMMDIWVITITMVDI